MNFRDNFIKILGYKVQICHNIKFSSFCYPVKRSTREMPTREMPEERHSDAQVVSTTVTLMAEEIASMKF